MRLSKPGFQIVPPLLCEKDDIPGDILSESSKEDGSIVEGFGMTSFLQLPTSFGYEKMMRKRKINLCG